MNFEVDKSLFPFYSFPLFAFRNLTDFLIYFNLSFLIHKVILNLSCLILYSCNCNIETLYKIQSIKINACWFISCLYIFISRDKFPFFSPMGFLKCMLVFLLVWISHLFSMYRNVYLTFLLGSNPGHFYKRHSIYLFDPKSKLQM